MALKVFRDKHLQMVSVYILTPKKRLQMDLKNVAKGTGGTPVIAFLKQSRDETLHAADLPVVTKTASGKGGNNEPGSNRSSNSSSLESLDIADAQRRP